ncbi:hypothetical protein HNY73_002363 [Argiope bruennichi]|uniref:Uncharacterized protein n=1 Tax=Argiope bruennichi TaxID=94029 RepID=A0A8T0FVR7_ARGBR|nr:hypothetical protein HNY73_002363 [Argiope bruennichi]
MALESHDTWRVSPGTSKEIKSREQTKYLASSSKFKYLSPPLMVLQEQGYTVPPCAGRQLIVVMVIDPTSVASWPHGKILLGRYQIDVGPLLLNSIVALIENVDLKSTSRLWEDIFLILSDSCEHFANVNSPFHHTDALAQQPSQPSRPILSQRAPFVQTGRQWKLVLVPHQYGGREGKKKATFAAANRFAYQMRKREK